MACVRLPSGREVMSAQEFTEWEENHELRGTEFHDALRREVSKRMQISNFRQLSLVCGDQILGPSRPEEPLLAVVRPYVARMKAELFSAIRKNALRDMVQLLEQPCDSTAMGLDRSTLAS